MTATTLPFHVTFRPGEPPWREVYFAATRAILAGDMAPATAFPSVRELSQALRLNTNTAHKVVAELVRDGLLQVKPGIGSVVTEAPRAPDAVRQRLIDEDVERLVVEARRLGLTRSELVGGVQAKWSNLFELNRAAS
jgi:GntR family transcriptional regulator